MTGKNDGEKEQGFSLVEVLVTLVVTGLVLTALSGITWSMRHLEERMQHENAAREGLVSVSRVFRSLVSGAVPDLRGSSRGNDAGGTSLRLTLITRGPAIMAFDRPRPVMLETVRRGEASILRVRWEDPDTGSAREEVLLEGARAISLSYFGRVSEVETPIWGDHWTGLTSLPLAVMLRVEMPALGAPIEILVRTAGRMPQVCAALPHEERCGAGEIGATDR